MEVLIAVVVLLIVALVLWEKSSPSKLPPGPRGLPIVGYIPFLSSKPWVTFTELAKKYGNVFSIRLGSRTMIVLNDFKSTREAFLQDIFIGRPTDIPFDFSKETIETGAFLDLPWKEQRRHSLHTLRDLGLGKSRMEDQIQEEIKDLLKHFEKNTGKNFSLRKLLSPSMSNNIASLVFGKRFELDDPVRLMLSRAVSEGASGGSQAGFSVFFPWLRKLLVFLGKGAPDKVVKANAELKNYVKKEIEEHEKSLNPENIRDFIDGYLVEIKKRNDPAFSKPVLIDLVGGFFAAGSDTVRQTVEWLVLTAATNLKAQRRIQTEIDEVVGHDRLPIWTDQKSMPFTEAFMNETQRLWTIVPINLLRYTLGNAELSGYFIPKHTIIISNLWAIHHDPEYWGPEAEEFRPERFLNEDGKTVKKWDHFIPFSVGKRSCPGEPLAKMEVFEYFVSILQRFEVKLPEGKVADFEGELGVTYQIKDQEFVLTKRSH